MILIADSGSTKTDFRLIDDNKEIYQFATQGINPYFQHTEQIVDILKVELIPQLTSNIHHQLSNLYFYCAGCSAEDKKQIVRKALSEVFPTTKTEIYTDILGAARALCGSKPGIAAILGTGANTCYYNGNSIMENKPSLGYILGDEGSGAHLGKTFVQAYLNDELPCNLSERFYERYKLSKKAILDAVYTQPLPNRFLASFSKFIYQNLKEQFIIDMVANDFNTFFEKHVCKYEKYQELKLSCTGSIAFYYSNILRAVAAKKAVNIGTITETPIAGLALFHLGEN